MVDAEALLKRAAAGAERSGGGEQSASELRPAQ